LRGILTGSSNSLTPEQIAELKKFYITPNFNFSPPTHAATLPVTERIDTYEVQIHNVPILKSGNHYFKKLFQITNRPETTPFTLQDVFNLLYRWDLKPGIQWDDTQRRYTLNDKPLRTEETLFIDIVGEIVGLPNHSGFTRISSQWGENQFAFQLRDGSNSSIDRLTNLQRNVGLAIKELNTSQMNLIFFCTSLGDVPNKLHVNVIGSSPNTVTLSVAGGHTITIKSTSITREKICQEFIISIGDFAFPIKASSKKEALLKLQQKATIS